MYYSLLFIIKEILIIIDIYLNIHFKKIIKHVHHFCYKKYDVLLSYFILKHYHYGLIFNFNLNYYH